MNLSDYIYKEGDRYYLDTENYTDNNSLRISLDFEDGDKIIWKVDGNRYSGILREIDIKSGLFSVETVTKL